MYTKINFILSKNLLLMIDYKYSVQTYGQSLYSEQMIKRQFLKKKGFKGLLQK